MKKKISLQKLKVKSFVVTMKAAKSQTVAGGAALKTTYKLCLYTLGNELTCQIDKLTTDLGSTDK